MTDDYQKEHKIPVRTAPLEEPQAKPEKAMPAVRKKPAKKKKRFKIIGFFFIFALMIMVVFSNQIIVSDQNSTSWLGRLPLVKQIKQLAESANRELKGESEDRINILLLGMGGSNHEGGYLTDTIMLASLEPSTGKVALVSIPRDMAVPIEDMGWQKINCVNAYAESDKRAQGGWRSARPLAMFCYPRSIIMSGWISPALSIHR